MTEDDLEQRIEQLEEQVFANNSNSGNDKQIGYLKSKLRDAGEEFDKLESHVDTLEKKIDRVESEEDMKEEIERDLKEVKRQKKELKKNFEEYEEELDNVVENHSDRMNSIKDDIHTLLDELDQYVEEYENASEYVAHQIISQSQFLAGFVVNSYKNSQSLMQIQFKEYFPECEESTRLWRALFNQHNIPSERTQFLTGTFESYINLVKTWRDEVDVYDDPSKNPEYFRAYLFNRMMTFEQSYNDRHPRDVQKEYIGLDPDVELYKEIHFDLGMSEDEIPDGMMTGSGSDKRLIAEIVALVRDDGIDVDSGADRFIEKFEGHEAEGILDMLTLTGVNEEWINSWDEETISEVIQELKDKPDMVQKGLSGELRSSEGEESFSSPVLSPEEVEDAFETSQALDELEEDGLIERKMVDGEERARLTDRGMKVAQRNLGESQDE